MNYKNCGFSLWLSLIAFSACAVPIPNSVSDALRRAAIPINTVGIVVQEVSTDRPLLTVNATKTFSPASTIKVVTAQAALEILGPTYSWKTRAYTRGPIVNGVLQGDLIIKGAGDPKLVVENLWLFLRKIYAQGVHKINGNVIIDRTVFEEVAYDPAQFDGDPMRPYNVGADAILFNYKTLTAHFVPDLQMQTVSVTTDVPFAGFNAQAVRLSNGVCKDDWYDDLHVTQFASGILLTGTYPVSCGEKNWQIPPYQLSHLQFFANAFVPMWKNLGGTLDGVVVGGAMPTDSKLLAEWSSPTLTELIRDMNKFSNNVMARQIFLSLAVEKNPTQAANILEAQRVVAAWLRSKNIVAPELVIENGSGLSRAEKISPATMGQILMMGYHAPTMPELLSSLPIAGLDGTMRKRLVDSNIAGRAHIKTGYIDGVRAIAGYVLASSGKRYVVVCFINHARAIDGRAAQDALLQWVMDNG